MTVPNLPWSTIHSSALGPAAGMVQRATVTMRAHGALRYQCPVTGSFVLVTDDATLARFAKPQARLRCMGCGEMHLLRRDPEES